ncbi:uncharacterized protein BXZ73DRAFT_95483 [Epithele typhae]|uniref:uncharacterized protein n=1 Tax=Epithele typhae TaxID=378194 RepID=UPI0020074A0E|nr:uncharacterized protein BXZ73DRAFT_95483 [Epithele typhae]KAH9945967.1 hypothetical protein BXZ73DRAFT_95483 [Epithele typhae]
MSIIQLVNSWPNTDIAAEEMSNLMSNPDHPDDSVGKRLDGDDPLLVLDLGHEVVNIFITLPAAIPEAPVEGSGWEPVAINRFWNGPESPFEARGGVEYIRPDIQIPQLRKTVMIRQEYKDLWAHMALDPSLENLVVIGHPGIGKTLFLWATLLKCLFERRPVYFSDISIYHASFMGGGFKRVDGNYSPPPETLALVDAYVGVGELSTRLVSNTTILSSSPQEHRYQEFQKLMSANFWVMKLWNEKEIFLLGSFPKEFYSPVEIMRLLGPCARTCVRRIRRTSRGPEIDIGEAVDAPWLARNLIVPAPNFLVEGYHNHFFMQPTDTGRRTSMSLKAVAECIIPTNFLFLRVMKVIMESGLANREQMFRALRHLSAISGYAFETLALTWCISDHLLCQIDGEKDFKLSDVKAYSFDDLSILRNPPDSSLMFVCPENFSTVDAFVVSADRSHVTFLQVTIATRHTLKQGGISQVLLKLLEHGLSFTQETRFSFIFVVPKDAHGRVLANHFNGAKGFSQYSPEKRTRSEPAGKYQIEVGYAVAAERIFRGHQQFAGDLDISLFPRSALIETEAMEE